MQPLDALFRKFIQGSVTQQEKQELFALITKPENDALLRQLLDEVINSTSGDDGVDDGRANEILAVILQAGAPPRRKSAFRIWLPRVAAAAAVLVLVAVGIYHFKQQPAAIAKGEQMVQDIPPAISGAVLTLGDGRKVPLDSLKQGLIATQGGTSVTLGNGTVAYNSSAAEAVTYNTLNTPRGRIFHITLPDGSGVWLNAASTLRYPTSFKQHERVVELSGEAYFEIQPQANMPFKVKAGRHTEIKVLGTGFNISAYGNDASVATTLLHGKVAVNNRLIQPGEQARVTFAAAGPVTITKADTSMVMAWRNGIFNFDDADIADVMKQLERWYDIDVLYENGIPPLRFGGKIERSLSLLHIARILAISDVHCRLEGRKLIVSQ